MLADEARVVETAVLGERRADERRDARRSLGDLARRPRGGADERGTEQEVFRRVAGDREFGKDDELGACVARLCDPPNDAVAVAVEVADGRVDLGERDPHSLRLIV